MDKKLVEINELVESLIEEAFSYSNREEEVEIEPEFLWYAHSVYTKGERLKELLKEC